MGRKTIKYPVYTIALALYLFFIVLPVLYSLWLTVTDGHFIENIKTVGQDSIILLLKSSVLAAVIAIISTFFGIILGFLIYKTSINYRKFFKVIILIPLFISPYILAVAWRDILLLFFDKIENSNSFFAIILVHSTIFIPLSILIIGSALVNVSKNLEESALMISGFKRMFFKILLPLIKPAILSSLVLVFIFSISEFSVPAFFSVRVFTTEIFTQFSAFYNHSLAMLQSSLLIIVCVLLLLSERKYIADSPFLSIGTRGKTTKLYDFKSFNKIAYLILIFSVFIMILLPLLILLYQSFKDGTDDFIEAFQLLIPTFGNSLFLALTGAILTLIFGFIAAYFSEIYRKKLLDSSLLLLFAIPSIVLGIALIKFYNRPVLNTIYSGVGIIIIGYVAKYGFIAAKMLENAIKQIPKSLDEAAKIQGIKFYKRINSITLPLVFPAIFAAFMINFLFCLGDLGTTIMVYPPGTEIMPIKVFTIMANAPESLTSSMVLIVFLFTISIILILFSIFRKIFTAYNVNY